MVRRRVIEPLEDRIALDVTSLLISEFMASNRATLRDPYAESSDWVEIWNPTDQSVDLSGWSLTDKPDRLRKWHFPPNSAISAGERLVVWASGRNTVDPEGGFHTSFRLDADGEFLALVDPSGTVTSKYGNDNSNYPRQERDVSFGLHRSSVSLVNDASPVLLHIPLSGELGTDWTKLAFDDSTWKSSIDSITVRPSFGYDSSPSNGFDLAANVLIPLPEGTDSFYARIRFNVDNPVVGLTLRSRVDDGVVVYINGERVADLNSPDFPRWNSPASVSRNNAATWETIEFDLGEYSNRLRVGENVLAIHGLNAVDSDDMLFVAELDAFGLPESGTRYLVRPTPGKPNSEGVIGFVAEPSVSAGRGIYSAPIAVELTGETPGASIAYTFDGSTPSPENGVQVAPESAFALARTFVEIGTTSTLRAITYRKDWQPSAVATHTYLFLEQVIRQTGDGLPQQWNGHRADYEMDPGVVDDELYRDVIVDGLRSIPALSLVTELGNWFGAGGEGIYPEGEGIARPVSAELLFADGTEGFQIDSSVEIQGGGSAVRFRPDAWRSDKLSMQLKFKREFGEANLDYPLFGDDAAGSFDTLIVDARYAHTWHYNGSNNPPVTRVRAQYTRDQFVADLQNALGGRAPSGRYVHLYLNGLYWGIYNLHERPDEHFAAAYFGGREEDYDVVRIRQPQISVDDRGRTERQPNRDELSAASGSLDSYEAFLNTVYAPISEDNFRDIQELLDVETFTAYMLANYYVGNGEFSHRNWYATYNRVSDDGQWRFHSWDAERVLQSLDDEVAQRPDRSSALGIHQQLMRYGEYRLHFMDAVQKHFFNDGQLTPRRVAEIYQARLDEVYSAVVPESARWGDNRRRRTAYTRDNEWVAERDRLLTEYFPARTAVVVEQFRQRYVTNSAQKFFHEFDAPRFNQHGGQVPTRFRVEILGESNDLLYTVDGSDPRVSATAISYESPISLNQETTIKVRMRFNGEWSALVEATFLPTEIDGDFNVNGDLDSHDIDLLFAKISDRMNDTRFDLTGDSVVDQQDVDLWIEALAHTRRGDADLDGSVTFSDFLVVAANFGEASATWESGDFSGDGEVSFADFLLLSANFGFTAFTSQ